MNSRLLTSIVIALAYGAAGWVSLQVAIPPDYVSVVFLPAGIALAAVLIRGNRVLPGVFLGSLLVQMHATLQSGASVLNPVLLVPAGGAVLQALVGAALVRRIIGFPNDLDTPRDITLFLIVATPLGTLVNCSISVPMLMWSGVIPPEEGWFSWSSWWLGDTLGILVASPLMFVFFGRPREAWRRRKRVVAPPLVITCALTALAFDAIQGSEDARVRAHFERDAESSVHLIQDRFQQQLEALGALERFVALSEDLNRERFSAFVHPILERYPDSQNFTWNPLVRASARQVFESELQRELGEGFGIMDRDNNRPDRVRPADDAAEYLPIYFVEPMSMQLSVVGLNPLSVEAANLAINRARTAREPAATAPFTLTQERGTQAATVIYQPVLRRDGDGESFIGIVSTALRFGDLGNGFREIIDDYHMELCLVDISAEGTPELLVGKPGCETTNWLRSNLSAAQRFLFAGRTLEVRLRGTPSFAATIQTRTGWFAVVIGLFATATLGAFLLITSGHTRKISKLVNERTSELADVTSNLTRKQFTLSRAQQTAKLGSCEIDPDLTYAHCSDGMFLLLDLPPARSTPLEQLLGCFTPEGRDLLTDAFAAIVRGKAPQGFDCETLQTPARTLHFLVEGEWSEEGLGMIHCTMQDVTDTRRAEQEIRQLALYDPLTGLPNRRLWMHEAGMAIKLAKRHHDLLAVLFLDLDQFKTVNDSLGHAVGDRLLATVAERLSECIREYDMLARLGGDEFVVLLTRLTSPEDAASAARKMLGALSHPVHIHQHQLSLSMSIGIAYHPADGNDVDTLLKHADIAMYSAKDAGRNNFQYFIPEMNDRAHDRMTIESGLRTALEHRELLLHYQPQIDAHTGVMVGVEALLRWTHPEMGPVGPDRFIPIAENCGLITPLGAWVMMDAFCQQAAWARAGRKKLQVAVNISALQFRQHDFVDLVRAMLRDTGANPRMIELEITESALMQPTEQLFERLHQLVDMGLSLSLDDFGTGYSSLAYLKKLPIKRLKLDKSFVDDLPGNTEDIAIASAAISMARDLDIEVVAEGVETEAQKVFLLSKGCSLMQGYFFARPMTVAAIEQAFPIETPDKT